MSLLFIVHLPVRIYFYARLRVHVKRAVLRSPPATEYSDAFLQSAVSQKQVDEILIRHTQFYRHLLEVVHRYRVQADGDLTLELPGIPILAGFRKLYSLLIGGSNTSLLLVPSRAWPRSTGSQHRLLGINQVGLRLAPSPSSRRKPPLIG
jgi:hypothetical protein